MALLDRGAVFQCAIQFVAVPVIAERAMNFFLRRTHKKLKAGDADLLSQRFTRAFIALNLVQGAVRTIMGTPNWSFLSHQRSASAQYYTLGTLIYYVFDTGLLAIQKSKAYDLWIHHIMAILFSSTFLYNNIGEAGWMALLLAESLVPWGFLLFYFKLNNLRANAAFKAVCYGGIGTLAFRSCIWLFTLYMTVVLDNVPNWLWWMLVPVNSGVLYLEWFWYKLYAGNLRDHFKLVKEAGGNVPSLWSVFE